MALSQEFQEHAKSMGARQSAHESKMLLDVSGGAHDGFIALGSNAVKKINEEAKKEEKKRAETNAFEARLRELQEQIRQINQRISEIDDRLGKIRDEMQGIKDENSELSETLQGLRDGTLDVDDALSKPSTQKAIQEWEEKTGKKFNKDDPEAASTLTDILLVQIQGNNDRYENLQRERDGLIVERDAAVQKRDDLEDQIRNDADANGVDIETATDLDEVTTENINLKDDYTAAITSEMGVSGKIVGVEQDRTELFMESIAFLKSDTASYHAAIDDYITGAVSGEPLDELTSAKLLKDATADPDIRNRIAIQKFIVEHSYIQDFQEKPEYSDYVSYIIQELPEDLKDSVVSSAEFQLATNISPDTADTETQHAMADAVSGQDIHHEFNARSQEITPMPTTEVAPDVQIAQPVQDNLMPMKV